MINLVSSNNKENLLLHNYSIKENKDKILHVYDKHTSYYIKTNDIINNIKLPLLSILASFGPIPISDIEDLFTNFDVSEYDGEKQTHKLLEIFENNNLKSPALEYCVSRGGYLGTVKQLDLLFNCRNVYIDVNIYAKLVGSSSVNDMGFYEFDPRIGDWNGNDFSEDESIIFPIYKELPK